MKKAILSAIISLIALLTASTANAVILASLQEVAGDLVLTYSGSIDLNATTAILNNTGVSLNENGGGIIPSSAGFVVGTPSSPETSYSTNITGPSSLSSMGLTLATTGSGDAFGMIASSSTIFLPRTYVSNATISGSATFSSQSFSSLGLTEGIYTWTLSNGSYTDTITLTIGAVPEPSDAAMALGGVAGLLVLACRRRR